MMRHVKRPTIGHNDPKWFERFGQHHITQHFRSNHALLVLHWPPIATDQNKSVGKLLLVTGAITLRNQTPRRGQLLPATARLGLAGATAVRMVHRVPRNT